MSGQIFEFVFLSVSVFIFVSVFCVCICLADLMKGVGRVRSDIFLRSSTVRRRGPRPGRFGPEKET